jgi:hypothetical protein
MRIIFFISCFLVAISMLKAQSTGFMGKRLQAGYGFHTSPALIGSNANNETILGNSGSAMTGEFAFNTLHEGFLEFAASSKWMICFSARYYKTTNDNSKIFDNSNSNGHSGYNVNNIDFLVSRPSGYYTMKGLTYTLYFKYYGGRYVAPWGRYVMFGPTLNTVTTSYDPAIMKAKGRYYNPAAYYYNSYDTDTTITNFGPTTQKFKGVNFMVGFGRTRIIGKRVTIDYGINIQVFSVMSAIFDIGDNTANLTDRQAEVNETNYIERTVKYRVRGVNRFNAFLKIGVLLF